MPITWLSLQKLISRSVLAYPSEENCLMEPHLYFLDYLVPNMCVNLGLCYTSGILSSVFFNFQCVFWIWSHLQRYMYCLLNPLILLFFVIEIKRKQVIRKHERREKNGIRLNFVQQTPYTQNIKKLVMSAEYRKFLFSIKLLVVS